MTTEIDREIPILEMFNQMVENSGVSAMMETLKVDEAGLARVQSGEVELTNEQRDALNIMGGALSMAASWWHELPPLSELVMPTRCSPGACGPAREVPRPHTAGRAHPPGSGFRWGPRPPRASPGRTCSGCPHCSQVIGSCAGRVECLGEPLVPAFRPILEPEDVLRAGCRVARSA